MPPLRWYQQQFEVLADDEAGAEIRLAPAHTAAARWTRPDEKPRNAPCLAGAS